MPDASTARQQRWGEGKRAALKIQQATWAHHADAAAGAIAMPLRSQNREEK